MNWYCTLFDFNYLSRGVALYSSIQHHRPGAMVVLLCLDDATFATLTAMSPSNAKLLTLRDLENYDPSLASVRQYRSAAEYYFTCKPVLMRHVMVEHKPERLTYLDSDLFCFSNPDALFAEYPAAPVMLTPHRFPPHLKDREQYGLFNAGWVMAGSAGEGFQFIEWWRARCLEWCRLEVDGERFADQKYLNHVTTLFPGSLAIPRNGVNVGPWSLSQLHFSKRSAEVFVERDLLVFFHFHGFRRIVGNLFDSGLHEYRVALRPDIRRFVMEPYLRALLRAEQEIRQATPKTGVPFPPRNPKGLRATLRHVKKIVGVFASGTAIRG